MAVTYDDAANSIIFYVDGSTSADDGSASSDTPAAHPSDETMIGSWGGGDRFDGIIDEVRFSKVVRSGDWIETSFNNQDAPGTFLSADTEEVGPGPVGYWSFDEGFGTVAHNMAAPQNANPTSVQRTGEVTTINSYSASDSTSINVPADAELAVFAAAHYDSTNNDDLASASLGGSGMTIERQDSSDGNDGYTSMAFLANPSAGSQTLSWTWDSIREDGAVIFVAFYKNVDTSGDPIRDAGGEQQGDYNATTGSLTMSDGDMMVAVAFNYYDYQDLLWTNATEIAQDGYEDVTGAYAEHGSGNVTATSNQDVYVTITGMVIKADSSAPTNPGNGTISGAIWQDESQCVAGKCLYFDGDDEVQIPDADNLTFGLEPMSISLWVKNLDSSGNLMGKVNVNSEYSLSLDVSDEIKFMAQDSVGGGWIERKAPNLDENEWQYVVLTYDGGTTNTGMKIYENGVQVDTSGSDTGTFNTMQNTSDPLIIGKYMGGIGARAFMDEVKIYPYARSAEEIKADYAAGLAGVSSSHGVSASFGGESDKWMSDGLVGYWKMDEDEWDGTSDEVIDASGNENHLTGIGDATTTAGKYGNAGTFDGDGDIATTTDTELSANFPGKSGYNADQMTMSMWINFNAVTGRSIRKPSVWQLSGTTFGLVTEVGSEYFTYSGISSGNWYHLVMVYDGEYMRGYVDGESNGTPEPQSGAVEDNTQEFNIGAGQYPTVDYETNAQIDEVRVYNRALSKREVKMLYEWAPGPIGYWKFDEMEGTTAYDSSGNELNGTLGGGTQSYEPTWEIGVYGSALKFDGTDDYVSMGNPSELDLVNAGTVSAWVRYPVQVDQTWPGIVCKGDPTQDKYGYCLLVWANTDSGTCLSLMDDTTYQNVCSTVGHEDDQWHHVSGTWDSDYMRLYIDGTLEAGPSAQTLTPTPQTVDFRIGRDNGNKDFTGYIDDVKVYNYARTQSQIIEDMNAGHPAGGSPVGSPVAHWSFEEGYGDTAHDMVGSNDGTLDAGSGGSQTDETEMWELNGKFGKALEFDSNDDVVNCGSPTEVL